MRILALIATLPAAATLYFFVFWRWFDFWRKHQAATYTFMFATFGAVGVAGHLSGALEHSLAMPLLLQVAGWLLIAAATIFGTVADRQIGFRVRSFTPFFEDQGRIELKTTGAYAVVRHPIYASGIAFQLGAFLATGVLAVAAACAVFTLGALWFTRQEERRLVELLDDLAEYERYRARVGGLFPRLARPTSGR
jgi:protein-S-isoprenylcysteine O-methyltransferase Ste14